VEFCASETSFVVSFIGLDLLTMFRSIVVLFTAWDSLQRSPPPKWPIVSGGALNSTHSLTHSLTPTAIY